VTEKHDTKYNTLVNSHISMPGG